MGLLPLLLPAFGVAVWLPPLFLLSPAFSSKDPMSTDALVVAVFKAEEGWTGEVTLLVGRDRAAAAADDDGGRGGDEEIILLLVVLTISSKEEELLVLMLLLLPEAAIDNDGDIDCCEALVLLPVLFIM